MQIVELAANGATVAPGDVVVQFDPTTQQRTLEQRRSELKQAESEIDRLETEGARRVQAAETELAQARSAAERARLDAGGADLVPRVEAEKRALLLANAELQVKGLAAESRGRADRGGRRRRASPRQKRNKAQSDVADAERIIASLTLRAPAAGTISLLPNFRAGGPMVHGAARVPARRPRVVRRADRRAAGSDVDSDDLPPRRGRPRAGAGRHTRARARGRRSRSRADRPRSATSA